jgi:hypothetical protein
MNDADKLKKVREMIRKWSDQPDSSGPDDIEIEAGDVLYEILDVIGDE